MSREKLVKNISWILLGNIMQSVLQLLISLATARYLGPANYGILTYVSSYVSFFLVVVGLGISTITINELVKGEEPKEKVIGTTIFMRFCSAIISYILVVLTVAIIDKFDKEILIITMLASTQLFWAVLDTFNFYFQYQLRSKYTTIAQIAAYLAMSFYRIILLVLGANIYWFAMATSLDVAVFVSILIFIYKKENKGKLTISISYGLDMVKRSYHFIISSLMVWTYSQIDKIMIKQLMTAEYVGYYSAALKLSTMWGIVASAIINSSTPLLMEYRVKDRDLYKKRMSLVCGILIWINILYSVFINIFTKPILVIAYGKEYIGAQFALKIVVWYVGISYLASMRSTYFVCEGKQKYNKYICFLGAIMNIFLNFILIPQMGIEGAALATLISQIFTNIFVPFMFKDIREYCIILLKGFNPKTVFNKEMWSEFMNLWGGLRRKLRRKM